MKGVVVLVAATLVVATLLTAALLLASSARGIDMPKAHPAAIGPRSSGGERRPVDKFLRHRGVTNPL